MNWHERLKLRTLKSGSKNKMKFAGHNARHKGYKAGDHVNTKEKERPQMRWRTTWEICRIVFTWSAWRNVGTLKVGEQRRKKWCFVSGPHIKALGLVSWKSLRSFSYGKVRTTFEKASIDVYKRQPTPHLHKSTWVLQLLSLIHI